MTKATQKRLAESLREWKYKLMVSDWFIDLTWTDKESQTMDGNTAAAHVEIDRLYKRAYIYANIQAFDRTHRDYGIEACERYLIHELFHVFLEDYDVLVTAPFKTDSEHIQVKERTCETLMWIAWNLLEEKKVSKKPKKKIPAKRKNIAKKKRKKKV